MTRQTRQPVARKPIELSCQGAGSTIRAASSVKIHRTRNAESVATRGEQDFQDIDKMIEITKKERNRFHVPKAPAKGTKQWNAWTSQQTLDKKMSLDAEPHIGGGSTEARRSRSLQNRGWTCYICTTGLPHGLSKRRKEISAKEHMQQCHDGQELRASKGVLRQTRRARVSNLPERATSREWTSADVKLKQSTDTTSATTSYHQRKKMETGLKEECKPYEGRKVKEAKELRPSQNEWKAIQLQPETLERYKQVHRVTKQEEQIRDK